MSEQSLIVLIGIGVGFLQAVVILYLAGIKADIKDLWKRIYAHSHQIKCQNNDCDVRETGNVIVPHESS